MSQPPAPGMAIRYPPAEPQATFEFTLPQLSGPGMAHEYHPGAPSTMPQPPAFEMAGGHASASLMGHSALGQPGTFQGMLEDPSLDDWVFAGTCGSPYMMTEADAFPMLSAQDLAPAPAVQAPKSRELYGESHHAYQPRSDTLLQLVNQSSGYQSASQGFHGIRNTEAPQPNPYAAPYGQIQPTQLPMDPHQMYYAPSISPIANTMARQASIHAAPYSHFRPTQLHVDPQQMYQAPYIPAVTNNYNIGTLARGNQRRFLWNNGMQFHAAPPGATLQPSNHTDNAAAERLKSAYQAPSVPPVTNNYNVGTPVQGNQDIFSGNNGMQLHAAPPDTTLQPSNHTDNAAAERSKPAGPPLKETTILQWDPNCLKNRTKHITNLDSEDQSYKSVGVIYVDASLFKSDDQ
ncbi:hypothetical protein LTS10_000181 [Elasticomyces elasticus]|nr:hypothetical protein LTS10_000181 [Elasticomyces elasticus]